MKLRVLSPRAALLLAIKNSGTTRIAVLSDAISGPGASAHWLGSDSCRGLRLAPGATCRAQIHFSPPSAGSYNATYTVTEAGTGVSVSAALSGAGTANSPASLQITPYSYSYVNVVATSRGSQTFTVQNTGGSPTTLASGATLDDQYKVYSIENDSCANVTLAPGAICTFDVRFSPTEMGCCGPAPATRETRATRAPTPPSMPATPSSAATRSPPSRSRRARSTSPTRRSARRRGRSP